MINLEYPNILSLIKNYVEPGRSESAAFLIWYLENYYRLDPTEAIDSVCDKRGDKGVDGIYADENDNTIYVFQSKISQKRKSSIGDKSLREFAGTLSQFRNQRTIGNIIKSSGNTELINLIKRIELLDKIGTYSVRGVFIANTDIDSNGQSFLDSAKNISFIGKTELIKTYVSDKRTSPIASEAVFDISGYKYAEYTVDSGIKALIAPIKAGELVKLNGIADQSVFTLNVRGPLGRTQVNKDIVNSIKNPASHKLFPLFHNGITIIANKVTADPDSISIKKYNVVNGCQSLVSLYQNSSNITDNLRILTKIINMDVSSDLSEKVTHFSNNQNGVKARDFKANNSIQIRLQNEFDKDYKDEYWFEIKRGEPARRGEKISNEDAGLLLMAFDLKEPWATHRRYQVFEEKHAELFGRPEVNAHRIVMLHVIMKSILKYIDKINNKLFGKYALTKFAIMHILRTILDDDEVGKKALTDPAYFIKKERNRKHFTDCIEGIIDDFIIDLNGEVEEYGEEFDYRDKLRDSDWVKDLTKKIVGSYSKLVRRGRIDSFESEWKKLK